MKALRGKQKGLKSPAKSPAAKAAPSAGSGQALPGNVWARIEAWDQLFSGWLKQPRALWVLALLCGLLAFRGNRVDGPWGILHYSGRDHQNIMVYDVHNHVTAINAAAATLKEGNLLIREVPWFSFVAPPVYKRYPFFQFYGAGAYFLPALVVCLGVPAYLAFLMAGLASFILGFVGAFKLGRVLGLKPAASFAGAALFTFAPYHLTDWYGRVAFTETIGLALLPWAFYGTLHCLRERSIPALLVAAGSWAWLMITHSPLHILGALFFFAVVVADWLLRDRQDYEALLRPFAAYAFGALLAFWALWPIARFGTQFLVAMVFYPRDFAWASTPKILFSPFFTQDPRADGFIGLQIGWPLLLAWFSGILLSFRRPWLAVYAALIGLCIFAASSTWDFWRFLGPLTIIQFPYRVLAVLIVLGAVLGAVAWDVWVKRLQGLALALFVLLLCVASAGYVPKGGPGISGMELSERYEKGGFLFEGRRYPYTIENPESAYMRAKYPSTAYDLSALTQTASAAGGEALLNASEPVAVTPTVEWGNWTSVKVAGAKKGWVVQLPAAWYPGMYRLKVNGQSQEPGRVGNRLAYQLQEDGDAELSYKFAGMASANALSLLAWLAFFGLLYYHRRGGQLPDFNRLINGQAPTAPAVATVSRSRAKPAKKARRR